VSNEEALAVLAAFKDTPMRLMTDVNCRIWWMTKGVLRDSLENGQVKTEHLPQGVEA
jgi:hypothetical protein